jgi:hypothetical protein
MKRHSNPEFETRRRWLTTQRELGIPRCTRSVGRSREHANGDAIRVVIGALAWFATAAVRISA